MTLSPVRDPPMPLSIFLYYFVLCSQGDVHEITTERIAESNKTKKKHVQPDRDSTLGPSNTIPRMYQMSYPAFYTVSPLNSASAFLLY
jgi:hypothetical protein